MDPKALSSAGVAAVLLACVLGSAANAAGSTCFQASDLQDWSAPNDETLYLRIKNTDYYRVDLTAPIKQLRSTTARLSVGGRGLDRVCDPADLELKLTLSREMVLPIGVQTLRRMTPEDLVAVSPTDLPGRRYHARKPRF
jgi:hypothetical protein